MASGTQIVIPEELFEVSGSSSFAGALELDNLAVGPDSYRFEQPAPWQLLIVNTGEGSLLVTGTIGGTAQVACGRCLDDFTWEFQGEVEGSILLSDPGDTPPDDMDEDEYVVLGPEHEVDLRDFLLAALMVDAPLTPLCRDDCAGLCANCGKNLNEGPCDCAPAEPDPDFEQQNNPFAALKNYQFGEN